MKAAQNIFILTFMFSIATAFGQVDNNKNRLTGFQQDSIFEIKWKRVEDSLCKAFYDRPKFITLTYEKNGKEQKIKNDKFIISINGQGREIKPDTLNKYPIDFVVDTSQEIILTLNIGNKSIQQKLSRSTEIINGATITFGIITDIYKQERKGIRKPKNEDDELTKTDVLYNSLLNDKKIKELITQKKIKNIQYVIVIPRVFGDGMIMEYIEY